MTKRSFMAKLVAATAGVLAFTAGSGKADAAIIIRHPYRFWRHRRFVRHRYFRR